MMIFTKHLQMVKYIAHHQPSSEQQKIVTDEKFAKMGHRPFFSSRVADGLAKTGNDFNR